MSKTEKDTTGEAIPAIWERWRHIAEPGRTIECPSMTLIAGDHDPPIVEGSGQVTVTPSGEWCYTLKGTTADHVHAMRSLTRQRITACSRACRQVARATPRGQRRHAPLR